MKRIGLLLLVLLPLLSIGQKKLSGKAFKPGEFLSYRVHYGFVDAGEATIEVKETMMKFGEQNTYHIVGTGRSISAFDWFFKVRDRYDSYIDEHTLLPKLFMRRVDEGGFIINQDYVFNQNEKTVRVKRTGTDKPRNTENTTYQLPGLTHDMLSAFYYARSVDFSTAKIGDIITVTTFFDEEIFPLQAKFVGREVIKTRNGRIRCIVLHPVIQKGRVFKSEEDLTVWISDDMNRIPVRLQANIVVGSVKMDLKEYRNLAHGLALVK